MNKTILVTIIAYLTASVLFAQNTGNITYSLQRESNPSQDQHSAYEAITRAMDSATGYYNRLTTITKQLTVQYNTGVQTADASFNGNIRFGASRSYMVVHTAMHEIAHTVGVGTTSEYRNLIQNGVFTGTHATAMLREIMGNPDTVVKGDSQHFWPFGLNYASEVKSDQDLINHCKIVDAMYKDMFGAEEFYRTCRIASRSDGRCMSAAGDDLELGGCDESSSLVDLIMLDEHRYRLEFGDKVLDIPNESRDPGTLAGLWEWNGGAHQQVVFEFDDVTGEDGPFRIRMLHSGLYLQAQGNEILQNGNGNDDRFFWEMLDERVTVGPRLRKGSGTLERIMVTTGQLIYSGNNTPNADLFIMDARGRIVYRRRMDATGCRLAVNTFAKGVYIASVESGGMMIRKRFVVR